MKLQLIFTALAALLIAGTVGAQNKDPKRLQQAKDRVENMARYVKMDAATTEKVTELTYQHIVEVSAHIKQKNSMPEEEYQSKGKAMHREYGKALRALLNEEQVAGFNEWSKLPREERTKKITQ